MAEPLKHRYSPRYLRTLAEALHAAAPALNPDVFVQEVRARGWAQLELKQRMTRLAETLQAQLPGDYRAQLAVVLQVAPQFGGFEAMFFPEFVARFGLEDAEASVPALRALTRYSSSEFAVRPFLLRYGEPMLATMRRWADDPDEHVRRLASEGTRPRLPWAMQLPAFIADPRPCLPILAALRDDPSEYVRRSVANHLNDIAKDHPALVLDLAQQWQGQSERVDRLLKHALRSLLKRGEAQALALVGHGEAVDVLVEAFKVTPARLRIGEATQLSLALLLQSESDATLRVEYAIDFVKGRGHTHRKVFKLGEPRLAAGARYALQRRHAFADLTTRRHHPGAHRITLIVNGRAQAQTAVHLLPMAAEKTTPGRARRGRA